ncbi:type III secretion system outer membrane ring subunit SctC [uncultured Stenotrophomonas sp.]|uniref:type III secretion system outer membrane ring subunit SctC n=1 Tax=uncultured Stenotrophomonas sp. TaxID=165438 RepID=UPI0025E68008|nr:type III secretion system outer membrane ring subunit SctC [uncultured Stenotrophomonas sp.]
MPMFRFSLVLLLAMSATAAQAQTPLEGTALTTRADLPHDKGFVARNENVQSLLGAVAAQAGQAAVVSTKASRKRVSGSFDLDRPMQVLATVSADLGLVWYSDGQSIYVYEASEQKNAVGRLRSTSLATLNDFLRKAQLADARFKVRGGGGDGTFYVAGPPVYVDIVLNAAQYLDDLYEGADASPHHVEVIRLEHSFVNGRRYGLRSEEVQLPGIGEVLSGLLKLGGVDAVVRQPTPAPDASAEAGEAPMVSTTPLPAPSALRAPTQRPLPSAGQAVVLPYAETNSLVVRGTLAQIEQIKRLVAELDVPRRQIELSLWIIDIKKAELDRLGVSWSGGINIGNRLSIGFNGSEGTSTLDGTRFLAAVQALSSKGNAHIVSRPVVLTQENVPAYFDSSQTFYVQLLGERSTSLEQVTYGTLVSVRPRVSSRNEVEMQLKIEDGVSDASRSVDNLPVVNRTMVDTVARVPHQKSLLIGGYTRQSIDTGDSGIPGLRRVPVLGRLFGQRSSTQENAVRVFLIQPRLLGSEDALSADALPSVYGAEVGTPLQQALRQWRRPQGGDTQHREKADGHADPH